MISDAGYCSGSEYSEPFGYQFTVVISDAVDCSDIIYSVVLADTMEYSAIR